MAELNAVAGDTITPIRWGVLVDGQLVPTASIASASVSIQTPAPDTPLVFALTVDDTIDRLTGLLPATFPVTVTPPLPDPPFVVDTPWPPGTYTGTVTLITNTGTYVVPAFTLTVLE